MDYFKSLEKDKRKEIKDEFVHSVDAVIYKKINRLFILSIIGIFIAVISASFDILFKTGTVNYVLDGLLLVFSIYFLFKTKKLKDNEVNKFALSKKEEKNKKNKNNKKSKKDDN